MATVGAGYQLGDINGLLASYARKCRSVKAEGANIQVWFDRACGAANNGSNVVARAATLAAKISDDGGTISAADSQAMVAAFDEVLYWAATFAPTVTLDVSGPSI